jgi:predicted transcriptional regulator
VILLARTSLILRHQKLRKKRDRIAIMAEILTEKNAGRTKTNVMHKCNLNFKQIEAYTKILLEKKLLAKQIDDNGQVIFVVPQRGKGFIKKFHRLQSQIE